MICGGAAAQGYQPPRTAYGAPDLQGDWTNLSFTRLQRPKAFKSLNVSDAEAEAWLAEQKDRLRGIKPPKKPDDPPETPDVGDIESEAYDLGAGDGLARIDGQLRTSWIVNPTDGRLPYNSLGRATAEAALNTDEADFRGPEVRMPDERCLAALAGASGPPMMNPSQNSHYKIIQTPTEVAIYMEMIHDVRIVRLGGRHPAVRTHPWMGDSIGWWDGDTLVVETTDQNSIAAVRFAPGGLLVLTPAATVTERFRRISDTQIRYDFTVEDPAVYTRPWQAEMVMTATDEPMFEYACHEGNYALRNILGGGRRQEREAAEKAEAEKPAKSAVGAKAP